MPFFSRRFLVGTRSLLKVRKSFARGCEFSMPGTRAPARACRCTRKILFAQQIGDLLHRAPTRHGRAAPPRIPAHAGWKMDVPWPSRVARARTESVSRLGSPCSCPAIPGPHRPQGRRELAAAQLSTPHPARDGTLRFPNDEVSCATCRLQSAASHFSASHICMYTSERSISTSARTSSRSLTRGSDNAHAPARLRHKHNQSF